MIIEPTSSAIRLFHIMIVNGIDIVLSVVNVNAIALHIS